MIKVTQSTIHSNHILFTISKKLFVEQELLTLPEHLNSPQVFSGVHVTRSLVLYAVFCRLFFVLFLFAIVLSVLWFTDSDCPINIFKLFFCLYLQFWYLILGLFWQYGIFCFSFYYIMYMYWIMHMIHITSQGSPKWANNLFISAEVTLFQLYKNKT